MHLTIFQVIFFSIIGVSTLPLSAAAQPVPAPYFSADNDRSTLEKLNQIKVIDLKTAQRIALATNPSLAAARERVQQARERVYQARSTYFPRLDALASSERAWLSDNSRQSALQTARFFNPTATVDDTAARFQAGLAATWTLFDGFERKFSYSAARFGEQETKGARLDAQRLLLASVASSYYAAQLAREDIEIAVADETFNRRQAEEAEARRRMGTGSLSDLLNFQIGVNAAKSRLNSAKRVNNVAMIGLAALMGVREAKFPKQIELARLESETQMELALPNSKLLIDFALNHRPDIIRSAYAQKRASSEVEVAKSKFYPVIDVFGTVDGNRTGDAGFEGDDFGGAVGLNLSYNIFAGGLNRSQLLEARRRLSEVKLNSENTAIQVASEVNGALSDLELSQDELKLQRTNASLVQQNRDLVEKEYQAGQTSLVRLNEAQRDLIAAQGRLALALVSLRQSWENLRASTAEILVPFRDE